jgi:hypothetical protein
MLKNKRKHGDSKEIRRTLRLKKSKELIRA